MKRFYKGKTLPVILVLCLVFQLLGMHPGIISPASAQEDTAAFEMSTTPEPGVEWEWRNPLPQGNSLHGITYGADQFVAVGESGTILTSSDGVTWTERDSGTDVGLSAIIWSGSQFVTVGSSGTILTSPDGITWTTRTVDNYSHFKAVTWSGSQYVAVGIRGAIFTSPDGITWTPRTVNNYFHFNAVTWSGSQFVAVGSSGIILTSPDGITWTHRTSGTSSGLLGVTWSGSQFVAVGSSNYYGVDGIILTSPDGVTWTPRTSGTDNLLSAVIWSGSQFVAVGIGGTILTSPDGITWTAGTSGTSNSLSGITWSGSQFVAVGSSGTILTSPDGITWTPRTSGTSHRLYGVTWSGSQFVAVGYDYFSHKGAILTSPDGITWTARTLWTNGSLHAVTWSGSQFVAVGSSGITFTSPDGITWTFRSLGTSNHLRAVTWSGSQFVAVGDGGTIRTSPDGITWTAGTSGTSNSLSGITWSGSQFVAVGSSGTILTSPDGITWTARTSGTGNTLCAATWSGSQFVAVGSSGTIRTSPDGVEWTERDAGMASWISFLAITWSGSQFVAVGSSGTIRTSPDGVTWTSRISGTNNNLHAVTWSGSQFVAVGDGDTILASGEPGGTSEPPRAPVVTSPGSESYPGPVLDTLTPTMTWEPVQNADYYALAIFVEPYSSDNIIYNPQQLTGNSHTVPHGELEPGKNYRWNIQAGNEEGLSPVSNTLYFQTPEDGLPSTGPNGTVVLTEPVQFEPAGPYYTGDTVTAAFTVKNKGDKVITLDKLLLGGRFKGGELPGGGYPDFTYRSVTLEPGQSHLYQGTLTISEPGHYQFFVAYYIENPTETEKEFLNEYNWNTSIQLGEGLTDTDRTKQIYVLVPYIAWEEITYTGLIEGSYSNFRNENGVWIADVTVENRNNVIWLELEHLGVKVRQFDSLLETMQQGMYGDKVRLIPPGEKVTYTVEFNHSEEFFQVRASWPGSAFPSAGEINALAVLGSGFELLGLPNTGKPEELLELYNTYKDDDLLGSMTYNFREGVNYLVKGEPLNATKRFVKASYDAVSFLWRYYKTKMGSLLRQPWKLLTTPFEIIFDVITTLGDQIAYLLQTGGLSKNPTVVFQAVNITLPSETGDLPPDTFIVHADITENNATFEWDGRDDLTPRSELEYSYRLTGSGTSWSDWTSSMRKAFSGLEDGSYSFEVRARDLSGNIDPSPARYFLILPARPQEFNYLFNPNGSLKDWFQRFTLNSPGELRFYDSQNRVTGLVDGEIKEEIPNTFYDAENKTVYIYPAVDEYYIQIVGTDTGNYGLEMLNFEGGEETVFRIKDIATTEGAVHKYTVDWYAMNEGGKGITIQIDADGDGIFEETIVTAPPKTPSNPSIADQSTGISLYPELSWQGGDQDPAKTVTYSLYFGTDETPPIRETIGPLPAEQDSISFNPGGLEPLTTYFWRVVARDNYELTTESPVWQFTTTEDMDAPAASNVTVNPNPAPVGQPITLTAIIDDSETGGSNIASAEYSIDGGTVWQAIYASEGAFDSPTEAVTAVIGPFSEPGVYYILVRGTDAAGNVGEPESILLAVYDPSAGFVTGGGWIWSPEGAYADGPDLEGRATFAFVSRYQRGANVPTGNTQFQFKAGDISFRSTEYEWLVIAGARAQYKGSGTINGEGDYGFMLTAIDGDLLGRGRPDCFRIKIWDKETGDIIYDNQIGKNDSGDDATELGGGSIVIHSGGKK